jgi:hypothetical protein
MMKRPLQFSIFLFLCAIASADVVAALTGVESNPNTAARVYSFEILLPEIRVELQDARIQFRMRNARDPQGAEDATVVRSIQHDIEARRINLRIRRLVREHKLDARKFVASDVEVTGEWEKQWEGGLRDVLQAVAPAQRKQH